MQLLLAVGRLGVVTGFRLFWGFVLLACVLGLEGSHARVSQ